MARQALLSDEDRRGLFEVPRHEAGLIRHYTLSADDIELSIRQHRGTMNRLGYAVQLCLLRHPASGRARTFLRNCLTISPTSSASYQDHSSTIPAVPRPGSIMAGRLPIFLG